MQINSISENIRRSALMLHSMHTLDRQWILSKLDDKETSILNNLLEELQDLGLPVDQDLLSSIDNAEGQTSAIAAPRVRALDQDWSGQIAYLNAADYRDLFAILSDESPGLLAFLLSIHPWTWQKEFLMCFDASIIRRIQECTKAMNEPSLQVRDVPAKKLQLTLIAELVQQVPTPSAKPQSENVEQKKGMLYQLLQRFDLRSKKPDSRREC
ncbi:hypothetical protein ACO0LC_28085 [Undibacterium sp. JH2W]|uniref:hypothetical protein n=1 Tax=Undibacterium sp. JH2W TaxID=3413037 RepID=UPI003BF3DB40